MPLNDSLGYEKVVNLIKNALKITSSALFMFTVSVTEGAYTNESEQKLDEELESARQIRDKLGGACEQWRISANLLHASTKEALLAVEHWRLVGASR